MAEERTLGIIKPDAVEAGATGKILDAVEQAGFEIVALKKTRFTREQAEGFYHVHRERSFFDSLVGFMSSGPIVLMVLEGEDAITRWRDLMGPTKADEAGPDTIRGQFGTNIERNAVHGSDAPETAAFEINYVFNCFERL